MGYASMLIFFAYLDRKDIIFPQDQMKFIIFQWDPFAQALMHIVIHFPQLCDDGAGILVTMSKVQCLKKRKLLTKGERVKGW